MANLSTVERQHSAEDDWIKSNDHKKGALSLHSFTLSHTVPTVALSVLKIMQTKKTRDRESQRTEIWTKWCNKARTIKPKLTRALHSFDLHDLLYYTRSTLRCCHRNCRAFCISPNFRFRAVCHIFVDANGIYQETKSHTLIAATAPRV